MNRRDSLKTLVSLPFAASCGHLLAAPAGNPRLLLVFLRGGYDAANLLVPHASPFYYEARPNIAIAPPGQGEAAALPLDSDWGLHPALAASIHPLYARGEASFIPFAGTDDLTRSHFDTQDGIELGQPLEGSRDYRSGFLNRLAALLQGKTSISFTDRLPVVFQGQVQVPNIALRTLGRPAVDARQSRIIASMYEGTTLAQDVKEGFVVRDEVLREMASEMELASRNAISARGFELEARRIARLMKDKYRLGFIDVGGWDTHVAEGGATGLLATRLNELGRGLATFAQAMGDAWSDTVTVVISEFGRTFRENGNRGTDHGHGTVYWVLGGGVRGKRIAGEQIRLDRASLFQNRDYPVLNEYRQILGGLFARMYGLDARGVERVFPATAARDIGLI